MKLSRPHRVVYLQHIAMRVPTARFIYAPNDRRKPKRIFYSDFLRRYAMSARAVLVSFANDGISNPQPVTAYGNGLDCWYIMVENSPLAQLDYSDLEAVRGACARAWRGTPGTALGI